MGYRMNTLLDRYDSALGLNRREFLWLSSMSVVGLMLGCAANPVTGKKQLMLMSEEQEIQIDRRSSPHQFSADYGALSDQSLNDYIQGTGMEMASRSHRQEMPYSFRGVNATYINAYAFPGGSIAATRGILLELENEAELAALLGHEIGHVNARHTAERMSKAVLASLLVTGVTAFVASQERDLAPMVAGLGNLGAGALLARYSRDDEREADALGMEYMVRGGHDPEGMTGLMGMLVKSHERKPSAIEMMFATHPMSEERYQTAVDRAQTQYASAKTLPLNRDRYMDHTASIRKIGGAIAKMQKGEEAMGKRNFDEAEKQFRAALVEAPGDYAGLVMMAKCQLALGKDDEARRYAEEAKDVNPGEAQAWHVAGMAKIQEKDFASAYADFDNYDKTLPGNPNTLFLKGYSLEGMNRHRDAARQYYRYLQIDNQSKQAQYAYQRLVEWGYVQQ
jgi:predicted Zn-dependent protease